MISRLGGSTLGHIALQIPGFVIVGERRQESMTCSARFADPSDGVVREARDVIISSQFECISISGS